VLAATVASGAPPRDAPSAGDLSTPLTGTGELLGTPAYMAPEQLAGKPADARSDQFAFCVTAWEAFTGERPFRGRTFDELVASVERGDPGPGERVPRRLRPLILRGLARDPAARWPSMERLLAEIDRAWRRPRRLAIAGGALAAVAALAVAFVIASRQPATTIPGCSESSAELAAAWSPANRARFETAVTDEKKRTKIVRYFERWSADWRELHAANCAAPQAPEFAARHECLLAIRDEIAVANSIEGDVIEAVFSDSGNLRYMPDPDVCRRAPRAAAPPPAAPAVRDRVNALRVAMLETGFRPGYDAKATLEAARATGYGPVVAEAMFVDVTREFALAKTAVARGIACARFSTVEAQAEASGHERMLVEALLRHHRCAGQLDRDAEARILLDRLDTTGRRGATRYQLAEILRHVFVQAAGTGRLNAGVAVAREAAALYAELEEPRWVVVMNSLEVTPLLDRHRGDDLQRAEALLRAVLASELPLDDTEAELHEVLWYLGRADEAPPVPPDPDLGDIQDPIEITVRVVDGSGPVGGAAVAAGTYLHADSTRLAMPEIAPAVTGVTAPDGVARLRAPRRGVIVARVGARVGAVAVPARPGVVAIQLVAAAAVAGEVGGLREFPEIDPTDRAGRARYHELPRVGIAAQVGGRTVVWLAPVDASGRWRLPAVVLPGAHQVVLQVGSQGDDEYVVQAPIELHAGDNAAPRLVLPEEQRLVDLVLRPAVAGDALAFPASGAVPATWAQLEAALVAAPLVSAAEASPGDVSEGALATDAVAQLAIGGDGPVVVCMLRDVELSVRVPVWRVVRDVATPPPWCQRVDPDPAAITRLVVDPTKPPP
jgi:hypothetical protein